MPPSPPSPPSSGRSGRRARRDPPQDRQGGAEDAPPSIGYLVRIRDAVFAAADFAAGAPLLARVDREAGAPPLALYRFEVTLGGAPIARGGLGTYAAVSGRSE